MTNLGLAALAAALVAALASPVAGAPAAGASPARPAGDVVRAPAVAPAVAPSSQAHPAVSEQACVGGGGGMSWHLSIGGAEEVGATLRVAVTFTCTGPPGTLPVVGMTTTATVTPAGVARLTSPAGAVTNGSGAVAYALAGLAAGPSVLDIRIDGSLCASAFGASSCTIRVPFREQAAPGLPPAHPARHYGIVPPADPARNAPAASFLPDRCLPVGPLPRDRYNRSAACADAFVRLIDAALVREHAHQIRLPSNWASLSVDEQLFVMADLERVARGLPPYVGLSSALDRDAQAAAVAGTDPSVPGGLALYAFAGNWAGGDVSAAGADYGWVYVDGWGGSRASTDNLDCTSPQAPGCWGHRNNVLGEGTGVECTDCVMGAGAAFPSRSGAPTSLTELFVEPRTPGEVPLSFTWKADVLPFLRHPLPL